MKKVKIIGGDLNGEVFKEDIIYEALKVGELTIEQIEESVENVHDFSDPQDYFIINPNYPNVAIYYSEYELEFMEEEI
ncbi:hypothetical protein G9F71_008870 [Clostridium sp. FP2]|uniref:hypothetical protein n=1 Tax=Clostridium sp. FP2 TaxID=2724481 RepID=UPI0013E931A0|nr:hypothetical protein [Clostridium sp. FP2]MBZ9622966.1 hypothetical protein [Clostridium sp. FP2]